jgi:hypothetical protein
VPSAKKLRKPQARTRWCWRRRRGWPSQGNAARIELATEGIVVTVEKSPFRIAYSYKGKPLVAEKQGYGHAASWSRSNSRSTAARRCTAPARARSA